MERHFQGPSSTFQIGQRFESLWLGSVVRYKCARRAIVCVPSVKMGIKIRFPRKKKLSPILLKMEKEKWQMLVLTPTSIFFFWIYRKFYEHNF